MQIPNIYQIQIAVTLPTVEGKNSNNLKARSEKLTTSNHQLTNKI